MTAKGLSSSAPIPGVTFLPSWSKATDPSDAPALRTCDEDGTHHWSTIKKIGDSGVQYLHAVNTPFEPTRAMLIGTGVHHLVLGARPGSKVAFFDGDKRVGKEWKDFVALHDGFDILTRPERDEAEQIAASVLLDPVAREYLAGARFEVPLAWDEDGIACSTSGVDIIQDQCKRFGDLKTTSTTELEALMRQCFKMGYYGQLAMNRRACRAHGIDVSRGAFLLCVETKAPFEVVVLEPTADLLDLGDRMVSLHLEKLRVYRESNQWPGRAQSAVVWPVPAWMQSDDDEEADA